MYYSAGTYEAFARPEKPEGADRKSAYIIGTGLAGLSAAFYLVREERMSEKASTCVAEEKWTTILNVCGICSGMFLR